MKRFFLIFLLVFVLALPSFALDGDKVVVVIDAGHGGHDGGTDEGVRTEKEYDLSFALLLKKELEDDGRFTVILTRDDDTYMKFLPRAMVGLEADADIFLSLHCNSNDYSYVRGTEAYISVIEEFAAYDLADSILRNIEKNTGLPYGKVEATEDTGDSLGIYYWNDEKRWDMPGASHLKQKSDYYSIHTWCSKFGIPSIIIEHGYLSNPSDAALIEKDSVRESIAKAEAEALIDYYFGHTHKYTFDRLCDRPASCTLGGAYSYRCKTCGVKKGTVYTEIDPEAHYWRQSASAKASCEADGFIEHVCQISYNLNDKGYECEVHSYTEELPATGHSYTVLSDTRGGHGFDGLLHKKCANCGNEIKEVRAGESHTYEVTSEIPPKCDSDGLIARKCSVCGVEEDEIIPKNGHDYEELERVEASGETDGFVKYRCRVCGHEDEVILSACEHVFPEENREKLDAACDKDGYLREKCSKCGWIREEIYPALGHSYVTQMEVNPTCTEAGFRREKCSVCGKVDTEKLHPTGHAFIYNEENHESICKICGEIGEVTEIDKRTFASFVKSPIFIGIAVFVLAQAGIGAFISYRHRNHTRKKKVYKDFDYSDE